MAVQTRLKRVGRIHATQYRVIVADSRKKCDGYVIEEAGYYDPQLDSPIIRIDSERVQYQLGVGAQPSSQVRELPILTGNVTKSDDKADAVSRVIVSEADKAARTGQAIEDVEAVTGRSRVAVSAKEAGEEAAVAAATAEAEADEQTSREATGEDV